MSGIHVSHSIQHCIHVTMHAYDVVHRSVATRPAGRHVNHEMRYLYTSISIGHRSEPHRPTEEREGE
jgi:hypothetical protein